MTAQYHFWPNGDAFDAWDVERLIDLARDLPVEELQVAAVGELDADYWVAPGHPTTVRTVVAHARRILDVDPSYPVILGPDGRVMDGMHRIARALLEGRPSVPAVRLPRIPPPDRTGVALGEPER